MKNSPANATDKGDMHLTSRPGWSHGEEKDNTFQNYSWIIPWTQEPGGAQSMISKKNQTWLSTSHISRKEHFSAILFSRSVMSDSLRPHESQHTIPPYPLPTPRVCPISCPSSQWCHPTISSSVIPFSSCPQSLPASGSSPMSQTFA